MVICAVDRIKPSIETTCAPANKKSLRHCASDDLFIQHPRLPNTNALVLAKESFHF